MIHETYNRDHLGLMRRLIEGRTDSLLDVGCGICETTGRFRVPVILALDAHRPYLENRKDRSPRIIPIHMDAMHMDRIFIPNSVSTVLLSDVIEHFHKKDAYRLLKSAERIASRRVILFTPRGFFPQEGYDYYNMKGEQYQAHRSGWEPKELASLGYHVIVMKEMHGPENPSFVKSFGADHPRIDALLAYKDVHSIK